MKKTAIIVLLIYILISFVGVTFAWMSQSDNNSGTAAAITYDEDHGYLSIASRDLTFNVAIYDKTTDSFVLVTSLDDLFEKNNLVPNEPIYFNLIFENSGADTQIIDLQIANMTTSNSDIFKYLYFGVQDSTGYPVSFSYRPNGAFTLIDDNLRGSNGNYSAYLMTDVKIPHTDIGEQIVFNCYFLLSRLADSSFEGTDLEIGLFRAVL